MSGVKRRAKVIMNTQHLLLAEQQAALSKKFDAYEVILVPIEGWTRTDMEEHIKELMDSDYDVVFLSPVPYMLMRVSKLVEQEEGDRGVYLFHRDVRYKAVDPMSKRGNAPWQLVQ